MECFIGKPYFYVVFFPENFFSRAFSSFHVIFFLRKLLWNRLAGAWGRSLQRYLKSVCPSSALVMVNSFMVSSCIEKNSSRFLIVPFWCCWYITHQPQGQVNHFYASFYSLITDNKSRQTTDRGESFILTFRVTPSSQYPPPLT